MPVPYGSFPLLTQRTGCGAASPCLPTITVVTSSVQYLPGCINTSRMAAVTVALRGLADRPPFQVPATSLPCESETPVLFVWQVVPCILRAHSCPLNRHRGCLGSLA